MSDVNGLKALNDGFGDSAGDILIRRFAELPGCDNRAEAHISTVGGSSSPTPPIVQRLTTHSNPEPKNCRLQPGAFAFWETCSY